MDFFSHADAFPASFILEAQDFPFPVDLLSALNKPFRSFLDLRAHHGRFWALVAWESTEAEQPIETVEELVASFPNEKHAIEFLSDESSRLKNLGTAIDDFADLGDQFVAYGRDDVSEYAPSTYTIFCTVRKSFAVVRLVAVINNEDLPELPFGTIEALVKKAVDKLDNGVLIRV